MSVCTYICMCVCLYIGRARDIYLHSVEEKFLRLKLVFSLYKRGFVWIS